MKGELTGHAAVWIHALVARLLELSELDVDGFVWDLELLEDDDNLGGIRRHR